MAKRKITKQLQYIVYGGGVSQPWKRYGEYNETKGDTLELREDRKTLLAGEACGVRMVPVGHEWWID
jgi:hypothetical protein